MMQQLRLLCTSYDAIDPIRIGDLGPPNVRYLDIAQLCDIAARKRRERTLLSAARHREVQAVLQSGACRLRCFGLPPLQRHRTRSLGCKAGASALDAMSAFGT
jgi:hypothetical protein